MTSTVNPSVREISQILVQADIEVGQLDVQVVPMPDYAVNTIYIVNGQWVLKTSTHKGHKLRQEASAMQDIAAIPIAPNLLVAGQWPGQPDRFYLLETRLSGQALFKLWLQVDDVSRKRYMQELVGMVESYQALTTPHYCIGYHQTAIANWPGSWIDGHDQYMGQLCRQVEPRMNRLGAVPLLDEVKAYYAQHRDALRLSMGKSYSHGDLHLYNVLADQQVSGIIDWEWAGMGGVEPDFELEALLRWSIYPQAIAEEDLEDQVDSRTYALVIPTILNSLKVLQQVPDLLQRLTIYQIEYELHKIAMESGKVPSVIDRLDAWLNRNPLRNYLT